MRKEDLRKAADHIREAMAMSESKGRSLKKDGDVEAALWSMGVGYGLMEALRILGEDLGL